MEFNSTARRRAPNKKNNQRDYPLSDYPWSESHVIPLVSACETALAVPLLQTLLLWRRARLIGRRRAARLALGRIGRRAGPLCLVRARVIRGRGAAARGGVSRRRAAAAARVATRARAALFLASDERQSCANDN